MWAVKKVKLDTEVATHANQEQTMAGELPASFRRPASCPQRSGDR
jgi:hypothetical protein